MERIRNDWSGGNESQKTYQSNSLILDKILQEQLAKLESDKILYEEMKENYNKKTLLELPDAEIILEMLKDEIGPNTDLFKAWYSA